ncbi:unnamed protein product, partial [Gadus morhua 'NCC']
MRRQAQSAPGSRNCVQPRRKLRLSVFLGFNGKSVFERKIITLSPKPPVSGKIVIRARASQALALGDTE